RGDLAGEGLVAEEARRFVVAAQQALFQGARRLEGHVVVDAIVRGDGRDNRTEDQRGSKCRGVRCPLHEPPKNRQRTDGRDWARPRQGTFDRDIPAQLEGCPSDSQTAPTSGAIRLLAVFLCALPPLMVDNFPGVALGRSRRWLCPGAPTPQILQGLQLLRYRSSPSHSADRRRP